MTLFRCRFQLGVFPSGHLGLWMLSSVSRERVDPGSAAVAKSDVRAVLRDMSKRLRS